MDNKLSIVQKENLCELVRHYPVIFDKCHKGYKEKDMEKTAWQEIASAYDFLSTVADVLFCSVVIRLLLNQSIV